MSVLPRSTCGHEGSAAFSSYPIWQYIEKLSSLRQVDHYDAKSPSAIQITTEHLTEQDSKRIAMTKLTILSLKHDVLCAL
jgi:hypothetical protein